MGNACIIISNMPDSDFNMFIIILLIYYDADVCLRGIALGCVNNTGSFSGWGGRLHLDMHRKCAVPWQLIPMYHLTCATRR